jgi:CubicO group peptidase (beta-lactamase class C family)
VKNFSPKSNGTVCLDIRKNEFILIYFLSKGETVKITLRELISMRGGIRTSDEEKDFRQIHNYHNVTETLKYFANDSLVAKPGTKFYYSNFGWHLIGAILESVTQQNYEVLMHNMFNHLKMNSSRLSRREAIIPHRSRQYTRKRTSDGKHYTLHSAAVLEDLGRPLPWLPMGAVSTSVPDLLTFTHVMINSFKNNGKT